MRASTAALLAAFLVAGCGSQHSAAPTAERPLIPAGLVRPPDAKTDMDTNPANLASAVVTYNFHQLPEYIDAGAFRLLPYDVERTVVPGGTVRNVWRLTVPRTGLVLDTVVTSALTEAGSRADASRFDVDVTYDGRHLAQPHRYWLFYRNNGSQICRIYFPGDLGALHMSVHSLVFQPLPAGRHVVRVVVRQRIPGAAAGRLVSEYRLTVLHRGPTARERAVAPDPEAGDRAAVNRTPLTFRTPR
ncbi:MAG: hypothetical protein E6G08_04035 [Actinobacteria bacterium]|nr:MAG: hypothetical protein E6G08_04035 [Actinomycetota bacterium]